MELIYRASKDGGTSNDFHNKCDNKGPTICLYKNEKGNIFGGYASISWDKNVCNYRSAPDSFIFTLTNIHNIQPTKFPNSIHQQYSLYFSNGYGPTFGGGHDICINSDFMNATHYANFPHSYQDNLGKRYSIFCGQQNNYNFKLKELEVFKLFN